MKRVVACLLLAAWAGISAAQPYPSKPVRLIVPFPAGSTPDIVGRALGQKLAEAWGQPVIVDNRPGAGANIGTAEVARAAPDGYTLLIHNITFPIASVAAALGNRATYNADADFAGVSIAVYVPFVWTAHPNTPGKDLRDAMSHVSHFKPYTYGSTGPGSTMHVLGEALARAAGVQMTHIPFKGAAPLKQELIAGRIHLGGDQLSSSLADIKAGRLKALATGASRRIAELPDVPTVRELGYPMLEAEGWNGFFAPAKTPREILERLNREFAAAAKHPEVAKRMREMAAEPVGSSGAEQEAIFKRQMDQFRPIIKEMRIEG
jgi:tripartite-type tricarboxylate transporter receptor subunit TctC